MPLNLQKNLPAIELLKKEHIFVMDALRASSQDIRPLRVVVLNLMPLKVTTETDLVRLLSNTPLQVEMDLMKIKGHTPKNTPIEHMREFYKDFEWMGLQRHLKVLGIFARLYHRDGKDAYLKDLPLVLKYTRKVAERYIGLKPLVRLLDAAEGINRPDGLTF